MEKGAVALLSRLGADILLYDGNQEANDFFDNKQKIFLGEFPEHILSEIEYLLF